MKEKFDDIDDLIGKSLAREASADEQQLLDRWLAEKEEHRKHFEQCRVLFEKLSSLTQVQSFDTDAAWQNLKEKISQRQVQRTNPFQRYWQLAASVVIVLGIGYFLYGWWTSPQDIMAITTEEVARQDTLPDGSKAFLNKQTALSYEYRPSKNRRVVKLEGEAFFEIKDEKEQSFIVETNELIIEDIGTSFNVRSYPGDSIVQVFVQTGEVAMYTDDNPGVRILPGEKGEYNKNTKSFVKLSATNENITAYKSRSFEFEATRLGDLIASLNAVYDRQLRVESEALNECRITVSFDNESIEVIAEIIAETLKLTITETENEIVLRGDACPE